MPGTKEGAEKRRQTMIAKYGSMEAYQEAQRQQAAKGGANHNPDNPGSFANRKKREHKRVSARGGKASAEGRKGKAPIDATTDMPDTTARRGVE